MKIPGPFVNYPPKWGTFDHYVKHIPSIAFGFVCGGGDVNRFAARYRAAKTFRRVEFEGLVSATADGYGALCQLLLTYSAFEHFLRCIGVEMQHSLNLLKPAERPLASASLRRLVGERELFRWLRPYMTNRSYQRQIGHSSLGPGCQPVLSSREPAPCVCARHHHSLPGWGASDVGGYGMPVPVPWLDARNGPGIRGPYDRVREVPLTVSVRSWPLNALMAEPTIDQIYVCSTISKASSTLLREIAGGTFKWPQVRTWTRLRRL